MAPVIYRGRPKGVPLWEFPKLQFAKPCHIDQLRVWPTIRGGPPFRSAPTHDGRQRRPLFAGEANVFSVFYYGFRRNSSSNSSRSCGAAGLYLR